MTKDRRKDNDVITTNNSLTKRFPSKTLAPYMTAGGLYGASIGMPFLGSMDSESDDKK
ncbi:hypothetical protein LPY66_19535 [Dehalobacter sp. DCM]|uniref:hypothetical protein n=1 Tax=Dehalobacter sp. DCM TaxID=2907827 RepID=UPI003081373B|nr:hypothetical protein LPY66_19535 [Dehalobacter sp. DCM]